MFPHGKFEPDEYGHSPGNGMTSIPLSRDPIATEGEATPGPDDFNPYDEYEFRRARQRQKTMKEDPTEGDDPFLFDDIGAGRDVFEFELPEPRAPRMPDDLFKF